MKRNGARSARTPARVCGQCGLVHSKLGLEIVGRVLWRTVTDRGQVLGAGGGSYAITARFWDAHRRDFDEMKIDDRTIAETLRANAQALAHVWRAVFNQAYGEQVVISRKAIRDAAQIGASVREHERKPVQLGFDLGTAGRARW